MKNKMIRVLVAGLFMIPVFAGAQDNISSRPVGFVKLTVPANGYVLASIPFYMFPNGADTLRNCLVTSKKDKNKSDCLMLWDRSTAKYVTLINSGTDWVNKDTDETINDFALLPTEGFILKNNQKTDNEIYLAGEVVLDEEVDTEIQPFLNLVGYPYSSAGVVPDSVSANFKMAGGYWVNNTASESTLWIESRPYANIFPAEGELPAITEIQVVPQKTAVSISLTIIPCGATGELLDVYYKDVVSTGQLDTANGWLIAAKDIPVNNQKTIEWVDSSLGNPKSTDIPGRYYLVGRSDLLDEDGVALCRKNFVLGKSFKRSGQISGSTTSDNALQGSDSANPDAESPDLPPVIAPSFQTRVIYVDHNDGDDAFSGKASRRAGGEGPKKTLKAGLQEAGNDGSTMIIQSGIYGEDLNISGKNVNVVIQGNVRL